MNKPLPFVLENEGKLVLNEEALKVIENSINPRLLLFYGTTRQGKSTTLNQLIKGNIDSWKYINTSPFESKTRQERVTIGCHIFGPIKCSEILRKHDIKKKVKEDFDIFFCDTEGLFSLNGQSKLLIPGILTLLQICTFSIIMINSVPNSNTIKQITSEIQFSKILQQMTKELNSPLVGIFISGYQVDTTELDDFDLCKSEYESERDKTLDLILKNINEDYPHLNITRDDLKVLPGGPYQFNFADEPDHEDLNAQLYWYFIHNIIDTFFVQCKKVPGYNSKKLISLIRIVFDIFKNFKELPKDPDLSNVLKQFISDSFKEYSNEQFEKINEDIKNNLKNNLEEYFKILNDDKAANDKVNLCIKEDMIEVYKIFIPEEISNFIEKAKLKLRQSIENQFERELEVKIKEITSDDFIENQIQDIKTEINKAFFKEDIDMNIVNNYLKIWEMIDKENEKLFVYFKSKKPKNIEILKNNVNNILKKKINDLISHKISWEIFFQEKQKIIQKEINLQYSELFRKIKYQEDFQKLIKTNDKLSNELFEKYNEKFFKNLPNDKKDIILKWIKNECEKEYNKLKEDNKIKPKWENVNKNSKIRISEIINNYLKDIFNEKYFRNEIDPNLGRSDVILNKIPKELIENPELTEDKQQIIKNIINEEVNKAVILFNKKREELPLLERVLLDKEEICNKVSDEKIKGLMSKFYYAEDKIPFNADNFYSLLIQNEKINLNIPQNNAEFNNMIKKVSKNKAHEYNDILVPKCPKWKSIKDDILHKIENVCENFKKKILANKMYKEDVTFDINELDGFINSLNLFNGVLEHKHGEIKDLINKMKEETKKDIISGKNDLSKWSDTKTILIQNGYSIMVDKSNTNLKTKNLNEIINILVSSVLNEPKFFDSCKSEEQKKEIINALKIKAESLARNVVEKKNEEEKKELEFKNTLKQQSELNKKNLKEQEMKFDKMMQDKEKKIKDIEDQAQREKNERMKAEKMTQEIIMKAERERQIKDQEYKKKFEQIEEEARKARERERQAREAAEREKQAREKMERERREREERERREREERERRERERIERERIERERREREERERIERERQNYFPACPYGGGSIVDGLKSIGVDSSYGYRCNIAARNGIGGYRGAPNQNVHMLNLLKQGRLLRP